jgi:hypothetical protein
MWSAMAVATALAAGCQHDKVPPPLAAQATPDVGFNAVWDAATQVLWEYRFQIDRSDRRAGVLATAPMTGRYLCEFWRDDAVTAYDVWEGTFQTLYRQVTVTVTKAEGLTTTQPIAGYLVAVKVKVTRSDKAQPEVTSASEAYDLFLNPGSVYSETGQAVRKPVVASHVPLGDDPQLEQAITKKIRDLSLKYLELYPRLQKPDVPRETMPGDKE